MDWPGPQPDLAGWAQQERFSDRLIQEEGDGAAEGAVRTQSPLIAFNRPRTPVTSVA
jgi:hypothetical protein